MANQSVRSISLLPTGNELVRQNRFVVLVAAGTVQEAGLGVDVVGMSLEQSPDSDTAGVVLQDATKAIPVAVLDGSIMQIEAGATVVSGNRVASDAEGRAKVAATGEAVLGTVMIGGAVNELISILASPGANLSL